jgi:hypothetical protein
VPRLEALTVNQQEEIARICEQEIAYFHERFAGKAPSSLGEPMSDTRTRLEEIPLTDDNSFINDKGKPEHIARRYMNYSQEEWRLIKQPSEASLERRRQNMKYLEEPEQIVARAVELLTSQQWPDIVVGLAVLTGRRLAEIMRYGEVHPKALYSIWFKGQLKNKKLSLRAFEIAVLAEGTKILRAWSRLRKLIDCSKMEEDLISKTYGAAVTAAAVKHFGALVPAVHGDDNVTSKTFRKAYARLAVFFLCPRLTGELEYFPVILGHYWENKEGEVQTNVKSSIEYTDYNIGDSAVYRAGGQRQGVWLSLPGVEILDAFKPKTEGEKKPVAATPQTKKASQTGNTIITVKEATKDRTDLIGAELGARIQDDTVTRLCDDYYRMKQIGALLAPYYEQLSVMSENGLSLDAPLLAVEVLVDLLQQSADDAKGKVDGDKKPFTPIGYLRSLLSAKRTFLKSYSKRHEGKDYSTMSMTSLKNTKQRGAADERFKRAVDAILAYNDAPSTIPDLRLFINGQAVKDLVGGRLPDAKEYVESRTDLAAHHAKYELTKAFNRRPKPISHYVTVPEMPVGVAAEEEEGGSEE